VPTALPLSTGCPFDTASWEQTPLVVYQWIIHLLAVIQQQAGRIAALEARLSQNSRNSDRPPSSDPPYPQRTVRSGTRGRPGAKPGHPGHRYAWLAPTEVLAVKPEACACGQREFPEIRPYHTHQVIELPEIRVAVTHVVLHETRCPRCGRLLKAALPAAYRYGYGPRLTALIGELSGPQRSSRSTVQAFCASVLGVSISRGAIQRAVDRVSAAITPHYEAIGAKARDARVNSIDETAWYQHGVLAWLWVLVNPAVAFFTVQACAVRCSTVFGAEVRATRGFPTTSGALTRVLCLHALHHSQQLGRRVPRLMVRPPCPFQESRIFLQGPFPSGEHDEHLNIKQLGKMRRVRAGDDMLHDQQLTVLGGCPVYGGENLETLRVVPVMHDALHHIGACRRDRMEHVPGHIGAPVSHAHLVSPQQLVLSECWLDIKGFASL
jgi:hypothetical protein